MIPNGPNSPVLNPPFSGGTTEDFGGLKAVLALGIAACAVSLLFIFAQWSVAILGAVAVLVLSAIENEAFMLLVIFMTPIGWMLQPNLPVRNVHALFHGLVVVGVFAGRI